MVIVLAIYDISLFLNETVDGKNSYAHTRPNIGLKRKLAFRKFITVVEAMKHFQFLQ